MVECDLAKVEVAGSNPVSRSRPEKARVLAGFSKFSPTGALMLLDATTYVAPGTRAPSIL